MRYERIDLSKILQSGPEAGRFVFTFRPDLSDLVASIGKAGLLVPPVLRERSPGEYQVVCGWRRIQALLRCGNESVEALVGSAEELNEEECLRRSLLENRFHRGFNEIEKALLFTRLQDEFSSLVPLLADVLEGDLKVPQEPGAQDNYRFLLALSPSIQEGLARDRISFGQALLLRAFPVDFQPLFYGLMEGCGLNFQESRQAADWIREICKRDGKDPNRLLESLHPDDLLPGRMPPRKRAQALLAALRQERFPVLESWRRRFEEACRQAGVEQEGVQIVSDPTFETTRIRLQISAASEEELQGRLRALHQAAQEGRMKGIFLAVSVP